jgi:sporulation protein YqfC
MPMGINMKRKNKEERIVNKVIKHKRSIYEMLGITGEILANEPKIIITGDYLVEIFNHRGIVDITDTVVKINTKKTIYKITGINLEIKAVTDDELAISGTIISVERIN